MDRTKEFLQMIEEYKKTPAFKKLCAAKLVRKIKNLRK